MSLNKSESSSSINTLDLLPSADPGPSQEDEPKDAALIDAQSRVQREVALRHADWAISKLSTANMRTCYDNDIDHYTKEMRLLGLLCRRLQVPLTDSTMNAFYRNGLPTELHELAIRIWSVSGNENLTINDVVPWIKQMSEVSDDDEMEDVGSPEIFAPSASGSDDLGITQPISTVSLLPFLVDCNLLTKPASSYYQAHSPGTTKTFVEMILVSMEATTTVMVEVMAMMMEATVEAIRSWY